MEPHSACRGLHIHHASRRTENRNVDHRENAGNPQTLKPTLNQIMKTTLHLSTVLIAGAALLLTASISEARDYGVSSSSAGRGTKYTSERGGTAYVGPRGVAVEGAGGNKVAANRRGGAAYSGPNSAGAVNRYGGATAVSNSGDVYRRGGGVVARPVAPLPARIAPPVAPVVAPLPAGYIRVVPAGYRTVAYRGYNCFYVGGIYYRPVMYQGTTVYVVVQ